MSRKKPYTAEAILDLINALSPEERSRLFGLTRGHPENEPHRQAEARQRAALHELQEFKRTILRLAWEKLPPLRREVERLLREEANQLDQATFVRILQEAVCELGEKLARYGRGPQKKAKKRQERECLIRQYRDAGMVDAKKMLNALRNDAPKLANITPKTFKNLLARL
jgi:hypothetical protein